MTKASRPTAAATLGALARLQAQSGRAITSRALRASDPALYNALLVHFGGLRAARRRLGAVERPRVARKWTEARVVAEIRAAHREGITVSFWGLVRAGRRDLASAAERLLGGLERARRQAGVPEPSRRGREPQAWSPELVIAEIRARAEAGRPLAATKVPQRLVTAARRHLGSWRAAVEAAGLDYRRVRLQREAYSKRELLAALRAAAAKHPRWTRADLAHSSLAAPAQRHFGDLEGALRAAGIAQWPRRLAREVQSREVVLRAIRARRRDHQSLHVRDVRRDAHWLAHSALRLFGRWEEALVAARVPSPTRPKKWTPASIERALRVRLRARRPMRAVDVRRDDPPLYAAVISRFGGFYAATERLGLEVARLSQTWSPTTVLRALRRAGHSPLTRRGAGVALVSASVRYFGSFAAAKRRAGVS